MMLSLWISSEGRWKRGTGKPGTKFALVENARPSCMERQIYKNEAVCQSLH